MQIIQPFGQAEDIKPEFYNNNYASCVWVKNFLSEEEITRIRDLWDEDKAIQGKVANNGKAIIDYSKRKSGIIYLEGREYDWIYNKIAMLCLVTNKNKYKFEITGFQAPLQLSKYSHNDFIDWHADFGAGNTSVRKLSISIQLSDTTEYEGGDLEFIGGLTVPREKGTAVIFPSFAPHRVSPVISGERMSIVGWIGGPHYR